MHHPFTFPSRHTLFYDLARELTPGGSHLFVSIPSAGPNGFEILIWPGSGNVRVCFGGLEQDFSTVSSARIWIERAMSQQCRLRIDFAGKRPYRWTLNFTGPDGSIIDTLMSGQPAFTGMFSKKWYVERQNNLSDYTPANTAIPFRMLDRAEGLIP
jgi:hypothetical protein